MVKSPHLTELPLGSGKKEFYFSPLVFYNEIMEREGERMDSNENEIASFQLILHSGNARCNAKDALSLIKARQWSEGKIKFKEAKEELRIAQIEHAQLLRKFANKEEVNIDLLLMHAEDHISASQVSVEMIEEMIQLYERIG